MNQTNEKDIRKEDEWLRLVNLKAQHQVRYARQFAGKLLAARNSNKWRDKLCLKSAAKAQCVKADYTKNAHPGRRGPMCQDARRFICRLHLHAQLHFDADGVHQVADAWIRTSFWLVEHRDTCNDRYDTRHLSPQSSH